MQFKDLILESFFKGVKIFGDYVEIYKNPSKVEMNEIKKKDYYNSIRFGATDTKNPVIYAWPAEIIHSSMKEYVKFDIGLVWDKEHPNELRVDQFKSWSSTLGWDRVKHKIEILEKMLKIMPHIKDFKLGPHDFPGATDTMPIKSAIEYYKE